jgi:hypothetical protein
MSGALVIAEAQRLRRCRQLGKIPSAKGNSPVAEPPKASTVVPVIIEIPATGEQVQAHIVRADEPAPLCVTLGAARIAEYTLAPMLAGGWRVVEATAAERALMAANGIAMDGG